MYVFLSFISKLTFFTVRRSGVGAAVPEVVKKSRAMAQMVNVPYLVQSPYASGGSYNYVRLLL